MSVETSNEDKVLFPDSGLTKGRIIDYYRRAAELVLRHAAGRPLSFRRCPDGIGDCFFQKDTPDHFPGSIRRCRVRTESGAIDQVVIESTDDLVYLANQACIELHAPLSRAGELERPDQVIFDLDPPPGAGFGLVKRAARVLRAHLDELGIESLLKTTGSRGLHLVIPIRPEHGFDAVRDWARRQAKRLADAHPDWLTVAIRKAERGNRLFLDVARNAYGQTAVVPYSVRAIERAPVAAPIDWDELERLGDARRYRIANLFRRLGQREDPWRDFERQRQELNRG